MLLDVLWIGGASAICGLGMWAWWHKHPRVQRHRHTGQPRYIYRYDIYFLNALLALDLLAFLLYCGCLVLFFRG